MEVLKLKQKNKELIINITSLDEKEGLMDGDDN